MVVVRPRAIRGLLLHKLLLRFWHSGRHIAKSEKGNQHQVFRAFERIAWANNGLHAFPYKLRGGSVGNVGTVRAKLAP